MTYGSSCYSDYQTSTSKSISSETPFEIRSAKYIYIQI